MKSQMPQERARVDWFARGVFVLALLLIIALAGVAGAGIYRYAGSREVVNSALGCVNTVVTTSEQPTGSAMSDGGQIGFRDDIALGHGVANEQILDVYVPPGNYPVTSVGDSVRVCLLSIPEKNSEPGLFGCDPAVDIRGRVFLVYDRANGNAQVLSNGEHGCGGA